mmetsp:Transcript_41582/g.109518  ORF Transcript_41582/g.109518 Transcript_41582/m.109518 type:complete len:331 (-) Transcript_41582:122-1114(-)
MEAVPRGGDGQEVHPPVQRHRRGHEHHLPPALRGARTRPGGRLVIEHGCDQIHQGGRSQGCHTVQTASFAPVRHLGDHLAQHRVPHRVGHPAGGPLQVGIAQQVHAEGPRVVHCENIPRPTCLKQLDAPSQAHSCSRRARLRRSRRYHRQDAPCQWHQPAFALEPSVRSAVGELVERGTPIRQDDVSINSRPDGPEQPPSRRGVVLQRHSLQHRRLPPVHLALGGVPRGSGPGLILGQLQAHQGHGHVRRYRGHEMNVLLEDPGSWGQYSARNHDPIRGDRHRALLRQAVVPEIQHRIHTHPGMVRVGDQPAAALLLHLREMLQNLLGIP